MPGTTPLAPGRAGMQSQADGLWNALSQHSATRISTPTALPSLSLASLLFPQLSGTVPPPRLCTCCFHCQECSPSWAYSLISSKSGFFPMPFLNIFLALLPLSDPTPCFLFLLPPCMNECCTLLQNRGAPCRCKGLFGPDPGFLTKA